MAFEVGGAARAVSCGRCLRCSTFEGAAGEGCPKLPVFVEELDIENSKPGASKPGAPRPGASAQGLPGLRPHIAMGRRGTVEGDAVDGKGESQLADVRRQGQGTLEGAVRQRGVQEEFFAGFRRRGFRQLQSSPRPPDPGPPSMDGLEARAVGDAEMARRG